MEGKQSFRVEFFPLICLISFLFANLAIGNFIAKSSSFNHFSGYLCWLMGILHWLIGKEKINRINSRLIDLLNQELGGKAPLPYILMSLLYYGFLAFVAFFWWLSAVHLLWNPVEGLCHNLVSLESRKSCEGGIGFIIFMFIAPSLIAPALYSKASDLRELVTLRVK
jgi:hypothetical protein